MRTTTTTWRIKRHNNRQQQYSTAGPVYWYTGVLGTLGSSSTLGVSWLLAQLLVYCRPTSLQTPNMINNINMSPKMWSWVLLYTSTRHLGAQAYAGGQAHELGYGHTLLLDIRAQRSHNRKHHVSYHSSRYSCSVLYSYLLLCILVGEETLNINTPRVAVKQTVFLQRSPTRKASRKPAWSRDQRSGSRATGTGAWCSAGTH